MKFESIWSANSWIAALLQDFSMTKLSRLFTVSLQV